MARRARQLAMSLAMSAVLVLGVFCASVAARLNAAKPSPYEPASAYLEITPTRSSDLSNPYVRGKVVVVSTKKRGESAYPQVLTPSTIDDSWDFDYPSPELHPKRPKDVGTIVWEDCAAVPAGQYTNGAPAYEVDCLVTVIDKTENLIVAEQSFTVAPPGSVSGDFSYGIGQMPTQAIADYVAGLPRRSLSGKPLVPTTNPTGAGRPWHLQKTPPGAEGATYSGVASGDASHLWAVGSETGAPSIIATTDGGATWTLQDPGASASALSDVDFVDSTHGWAVGAQGTILATTDGGATWRAQSAPIGESLSGVSFVDAMHGWAVGDRGTVLATADGGATWSAQDPGTTVASLMDVDFVDASHGWAVGGRDASLDANVILATVDGGATWRTQTVKGAAAFDAVSFVDARHGWAVGQDGTIVATSDGGAHWARQKSRTSEYLDDVWFVDARHGWVVGGLHKSTVLATTDGGATWARQKAGSDRYYAVTFVDRASGWAVGDTIAATTNGGASRRQ